MPQADVRGAGEALSTRQLPIVRTAVIGAGRMGRRHVQAAQSLGLDVIGLHDNNAAALTAAGRSLGLDEHRLFDSAASLLEQRPDCVIVATTAPTHADLTCAAANAGARFILCEKPMATSLAECDRMILTCRDNGARLAVNHQMRFMEIYTEPKRLLESDAHGGLQSMVVLGGNFGLAMNGSHYFEAFRFLTGERANTVRAWLNADRFANPRGAQFEDRAGEIRLTTPTGRRLYLNASGNHGYGMRSVYASRHGQIDVDELSGHLVSVAREAEHRSLPTTRYGMPARTSAIKIPPVDAVSPSRAVLNALISGGDTPSGDDGRLAVQILVAAHVSSESDGAEISLGSSSLPFDRVFPWA